MQSSIKDWRASKLTTTYKMTLMYLLIIIHINNQSILYKVNRVVIRVQYTNCLSKILMSFTVLCTCGSATSKEKERLESLCKVWFEFLDKDTRDRSYWTADLFTWPSKLLRCLLKVPCSSGLAAVYLTVSIVSSPHVLGCCKGTWGRLVTFIEGPSK
jgi:hypothetical protein